MAHGINRRIFIRLKWILLSLLGLVLISFFSLLQFEKKEYSRENVKIKTVKKAGVDSFDLVWEADDNIAKVFVPSCFDYDELELFVENSVYITVDDARFFRAYPIENLKMWGQNEVLIWDRETGDLVDQFHIEIYKATHVPTVFVETTTGSIEQIDEDKKNKESIRLVFALDDGTVDYKGVGNISGRGNSTWDSKKKPYEIKLSERASVLGMGELDEYILLANSYDATYMNNMVGLDLARKCGIRATPKAQWVNLYMNRKYQGLYLLTEGIVVDENSVDIPKLSKENHKVNASNYNTFDDGTKRGVIYDENPKDITGGYFLVRDFWTEEKNENRKMPVSWFCTDAGFGVTIKEPKYSTKEEVDYISDLICNMEKALYDSDGINRTTGKKYDEYIDIESWARWYIIAELSRDRDKDGTNTYLIKYPDSINDKIYMGPAWDFDDVWGTDEDYRDTSVVTKLEGGWFKNICDDELFSKEIYRVWKSDFYPYINLELLDEMSSWKSYISDSVDMDVARWNGHYGIKLVENDDGEFVERLKYSSEYDLSSNCDRLYKWIIERSGYLNEYWNSDK